MRTIIAIMLLLPIQLFAQHPDYNKPFTEVVMEKEAYFEQQKEILSEKEFYAEGGEYNSYQKWYKYWLPRIAPNGTMRDYYQYLGTIEATNESKALGNLDDWYELGPIDKPTAGVSSIGGGDRGIGLINSVIVHRKNPRKLLANSKAGGLFFSADKGQTWTNAGSDGWWRSGCHSMEFDPDNEQVWYASNTIGGSYYSPPIGSGGGVYRTVDSGLNWFLIADVLDFDPNPSVGADVFVNAIKIDPENPNVGYLGTNLGLYRSTNINDVTPSNVTWSKVVNGYIEDIEFKSDGSSIVFIAHESSGSWMVSKSTDGGTTWSTLPGFTFGSSTEKVIIEVSDAAPDNIYIVDHAATSTIRLFNYSSSTWSVINTANWAVGYGHAFGVSNFNSNYMYIFDNLKFKKSSDGGATFSTVSTFGATAYHVDVEDIVTPYNCAGCSSSANEVYVATHGGVNYSNDNVNTLSTRSYGLGVAKVTEPSNSALSPEMISMGLDHDGTVLSDGSYSSTWIPGWKTIYGGDGGFTEIDYSNSDVLWYEPQVSPPRVSLNKGLSSSGTNFPISNDFYTEMIQNKTYPKILYSKGRANGTSTQYEEVYRSDNYGLSGSVTEQISDFQLLLPPNQWIWGIKPARTNPNYLYAWVNANAPTWVGHFYRTTSALSSATTVKSSWEELPMPSGGSAKAIDIRDEDVVYISAGGSPWDPTLRLYKVDYSNPATALSTMVDISGDPGTGGLPDIPINSVVQELGSNGGIYVSTDVGVFYANNESLLIGGSSLCIWSELGSSLPNIQMTDLEINYIANRIRVASPGRGIWEHDLWCPEKENAKYSGVQSGDNFYEVYDFILSTAIIDASSKIDYRAGTYIDLNPGFYSKPNVKGYFEAFIHPCSFIGSSPYLKESDALTEESASNESLMKVVKKEITAFPNPSSGIFNLNITNDEEYEINVYNSSGQIVLSKELTKVIDLQIDLSEFKSGIYFVRCSNHHDMKSITIVKD